MRLVNIILVDDLCTCCGLHSPRLFPIQPKRTETIQKNDSFSAEIRDSLSFFDFFFFKKHLH